MCCQIFRQIVSKFRRNTDIFQGVLVQGDGKYASRLSDALRSEPKANAERFRELMQSSGAKNLCRAVALSRQAVFVRGSHEA